MVNGAEASLKFLKNGDAIFWVDAFCLQVRTIFANKLKSTRAAMSLLLEALEKGCQAADYKSSAFNASIRHISICVGAWLIHRLLCAGMLHNLLTSKRRFVLGCLNHEQLSLLSLAINFYISAIPQKQHS
ncbi:MAG: hypothetical protein U5K75_09735 [Ahrensia sp.]|nr:hypothetical protein [Ahrensia sp.]